MGHKIHPPACDWGLPGAPLRWLSPKADLSPPAPGRIIGFAKFIHKSMRVAGISDVLIARKGRTNLRCNSKTARPGRAGRSPKAAASKICGRASKPPSAIATVSCAQRGGIERVDADAFLLPVTSPNNWKAMWLFGG